MMPDAVRAHSEVQINDSCNECCCFKWRRPDRQEAKVQLQAPKMTREDSPRHAQHTVSHVTIDVTQTDDVQFVQEFSVPAGTVPDAEAHTH